MEFIITEDWLDQYGIDIGAFMEALENMELDPYPNEDGVWIFTADDANKDNIPDFLADLVTNPVITNPSQGGAIGG